MNSEGQRLKQSGFTLIEVMIAVVLLAIIFAITFNVLHFAVKAWDKGVVRAEVTNRVTLVQDLLRSAMMQAQPVALKTDDHSKQLAFIGGE
ncbi:PulJ/GspJ family protein, partial [Kaarinaea lacus]